jgi:hypothetical protein
MDACRTPKHRHPDRSRDAERHQRSGETCFSSHVASRSQP